MSAAARIQLTRGVLAASALAGAAIVWVAIAGLHPAYGVALATLATAALLWWWRGVFSRRRVVLWLEERVPSLRFSLAALEDAPATPFRPALERAVQDARFGRPLALAALRLVGIPLGLLFVAQFAVRPLVERVSGAAAIGRAADADPSRSGGSAGGGRLVAVVTSPSYIEGARPERLNDPSTIAALAGSGIRFSGSWTGAAMMPARPTVIRLESASGTRIVALEPRADSTPVVVLDLPARDSVLASPTGTLRLAAQARDDIGLAAGWFEIIVSSGSGESFTFRTAMLGRTAARNARALSFATTLRLDSLKLGPGDVVHLRAVARDANPSASAESGSSVTRTLRVPRAGENDSLSITPAPPPEVGQSEVSQRMLIILTERLVARQRRLSTEDVQRESGTIARDQARLRKRVGEIIFSRLTGEEHEEEEIDAVMADTVSPAEALLRAASEATNIEVEHTHGDQGPVVGVNRPLLEAFNAMWEAERHLGVGAPRTALPHMRAALDAIQRARAAERLYLRGMAPRVVIDEERIRLSGKRDEMAPVARSPRASALNAQLLRRARFHAALRLLVNGTAGTGAAGTGTAGTGDAGAAIDSLLVLRIDVLEERPALASALSAAIADLRAGRDATASLLAARRALDGAPVRGREPRWGGAW